MMTLTTFITQKQLLVKGIANADSNPFLQQQKLLVYVFPLMFAVFGINFPIGVLIYWLTTNLWSMGQQYYVIRNNPAPGSQAFTEWEERQARKAAKRAGAAGAGGTAIEAPPEPDPEPKAVRNQPKRKPRSQRKGRYERPRSHPSAGGFMSEATTETVTTGEPSETEAPSLAARLEREGDVAADYIEELLDIADLDGDIDMDVEGERALVSIVGGDIGHLVGEEGAVVDALQELTRLAVLRETGERSRLMLDVAGWRQAKRAALTEAGTAAAEQVKESGEPVSLEPMTPFERKIVHDAVAAAGLTSESEGQEPHRHVVVQPA